MSEGLLRCFYVQDRVEPTAKEVPSIRSQAEEIFIVYISSRSLARCSISCWFSVVWSLLFNREIATVCVVPQSTECYFSVSLTEGGNAFRNSS